MKIALVIVSYNSYTDICRLLDSLQGHVRVPDMVIVVDNCSPNGDGQRLARLSESQDIVFIDAKQNGGFAAGCNIGIEYAKQHGATHVGLINPDTTIRDSSFLTQIITGFSQGIYDIIGTYVINMETQCIEFGGADMLPALFYPRIRHKNQQYIHRDSICKIEPTDYTTGSSLFFSIGLYGKIGGMDESYFLYFEETDWCLRARSHGYRIGIISSTAIEHHTSQSVGFRSSLYVRCMIRNYARFALRYASWYDLPGWLLLYVSFWVPGQIVSHLYRKLLNFSWRYGYTK